MKHVKPIGLALLAILVLGAFAAATASAEEGFLNTPKTGTLLGGVSLFTIKGGLVSIECKKLDDSTFTFSSDKTSTGTIHWLECSAAAFAANSLVDSTGIILVPTRLVVC